MKTCMVYYKVTYANGKQAYKSFMAKMTDAIANELEGKFPRRIQFDMFISNLALLLGAEKGEFAFAKTVPSPKDEYAVWSRFDEENQIELLQNLIYKITDEKEIEKVIDTYMSA
ncbi:MAG: hypothetical protein IJ398_02025 [Clostridia bacterium]|nr:hypothetical protein [Clostridia bacterium]